MNNKNWQVSREAYVAYREVKRRLRRIIKEHNASYQRFERALKRFMDTQAEAMYRLHDPTQAEKLIQGYENLQKRKRKHNECHESYSTTLKEFRDAEAHYCVTVFKILRNNYDFKLMELGSIFGVWHQSIVNWIESDDNTQQLGELYDDEFGELSRLEDLDEDE